MAQALYRKWRSQTFDELIGQQHVTQTLSNALQLGRVRHAYLFAGPRGTGKTSMARLLAKAVNCLAEDIAQRPCNECAICRAISENRLLDLIEIDAASNTGVDDIRDLRDKVSFRPSEARIKFYIIDEVHMLSNSAFNALLKTLEEPPSHVIFVLATTEPEKIPATITSRCQRFDFKRISVEEVAQRLAHIVEQESLQADYDALKYIARQGGGSMRDAISLLDQLTAYGTDTITLKQVQTVLGAVSSHTVIQLVESLIAKEIAQGLDIINQVTNAGTDTRQFTREVVEHLRSVLLVKLGDGKQLLNVPEETFDLMKNQANQADVGLLLHATDLFNQALLDLKSNLLAIPQLPLELAFVQATITIPKAAQSAVATPSTKKPAVATAAPKSPSPPPTNSSSGVVDEQTVQRCFQHVVAEIAKKNKLMSEVLRTQAIFNKVSGHEIYFSVDDNFKVRFEKPQPAAALNEVFSRMIGRKVVVRFLSNTAATPSEADLPDKSQALAEYAEELSQQN